MEEAVSRDGRKRRSVFEPANERGDKRRRTCCPNECELTTRVLALESTVRRLTANVEELLAWLPVSPSTISIRAEASKRHTCPAGNCTRDFDRADHLHRHIRGIDDEPHRGLARILDQKYCIQCSKEFSRPCDLVRHEKAHHGETYRSRVYKFASHQLSPTPPDTSSNASADLDNIASESEQQDVEDGSTTLPLYESSTCFNATPFGPDGYPQLDNNGGNRAWFVSPTLPTYSSVSFNGTPFGPDGYPQLDNKGDNGAWFVSPTVPTYGSVSFNGTPFGPDGFPQLDNNRAGLASDCLAVLNAAPGDSSKILTQGPR